MSKQVVRYARVSTEKQAEETTKVSLPQQLLDMDSTCNHHPEWEVIAAFIDDRDYIATKAPKRGKKINPSGTRDDRPEFVKMLDLIRTGEVDIILCAFDDRLYRHERVVTAIKEALEEGEAKRKGREIEIWQTSGIITKDFMYLQAMMWRKENERRKERFANGRAGTLLQGRWPGGYLRLGYTTIKEEGKRGVKISLADEAEVQTVKDIFNWYDSGKSLREIRRRLISRGVETKGVDKRPKKIDWAFAVISAILHAKDYTGIAMWTFGDGTGQTGKSYEISIPQIIDNDLFERVQKRLGTNGLNSQLATRNAKGIYLLQGIGFCGCGARLNYFTAGHNYKKMADGSTKRYERKVPLCQYRCVHATNYADDPSHPYPRVWNGPELDNSLWRYVADHLVQSPELIAEQVKARQADLILQGDSFDGEIAKLTRRLQGIEDERMAYTRQLGRGKIKESAFDALMAEADEMEGEAKEELARLKTLRDNAKSIQAGLDYAYNLMASIRVKLPQINQTPEELKALPEDRQKWVLTERLKVIRALCEKVTIHHTGRIVIEGLLDGGEVSEFELTSIHIDLAKLLYRFEFTIGVEA